MGKDFYEKFGEKTFSANKIKELLTDETKSNFNTLLEYRGQTSGVPEDWPLGCGYAICYGSKKILHYAYPFYDLANAPKDMGLGMMTRVVAWALNPGGSGKPKKYIYLGSAQRPTDTYKLQFAGIEWLASPKLGEGGWSSDLTKLKDVLRN